MGEPRSVRDPIHGFIRLNGEETEVVSTPIFQRLRGIRQLAFANLVYPGALHTRFDHTLGVFHISTLLCEIFDFSNEDTRLVRLSALLHDLGHGPFSHVSENALEIFAAKDKLTDRLKGENPSKIHELVTQDLLRRDPDLNRLLGPTVLNKVQTLLSEGYGEPVLRSVVSGPLDADKQDYLLRDSYFCGVKYGIFDLQQLHRELSVKDDPIDGKQLMITPDGVHALEQFVLAKHYLTAQVYSHRVRQITDSMVVRAIVLGIEDDRLEELENLYKYDGQDKFIYNYSSWDDARFMLTFGAEKFRGTHCHEIVTRLKLRRLLKEVFSERVTTLDAEYRELISNISKPANKTVRRALEEQISKAIQSAGLKLATQIADPSKLVIANSFRSKAVRELSKNDEGPILVRKGNQPPTTFENESIIFQSLTSESPEATFAVYAPVEYENPTERRELRKKLREPILLVLKEFKNAKN
jgi:HD superfamily phosphohydrolase